MPCAECKIVADQLAIAQEEFQKLRDHVVAHFGTASSDPAAMRSLAAAERSVERALAAIERHLQAEHSTSPGLAAAR